MNSIAWSSRQELFEIYLDKNHAGVIMIFNDTSKDNSSKRDMCFMICNCEEWRGIEIWKEHIVA